MAKYIPNANVQINQAIQFATIAHGNQVRKGNSYVPYIFHPIDVANEIMFYSGLSEDTLETASIIGILHDVVEDTAVTEQDVRDHFGKTICAGVCALSKNESIPKEDRLAENLKRLRRQPQYVRVVKLADRVSNLKNFPAMWDRAKIGHYLDESALIAQSLGAASETLNARLLMRIAENRNRLSLFA